MLARALVAANKSPLFFLPLHDKPSAYLNLPDYNDNLRRRVGGQPADVANHTSVDVAARQRVSYNPGFCLGIITKLAKIEATRMRIGIGHDTHRLSQDGPLRLGGIDHAADCHLVGVSDADVLLHAVTDALLGAAALGDIGDWFPDSDPQNSGRDSTEMLQMVHQACRRAGYEIGNLDCIVFAERPKLGAKKRQMAERIASILCIPLNKVNVKAKTGEGLGAVGRGQAMMAECIVLLNESNDSTFPKS